MVTRPRCQGCKFDRGPSSRAEDFGKATDAPLSSQHGPETGLTRQMIEVRGVGYAELSWVTVMEYAYHPIGVAKYTATVTGKVTNNQL